MWVWAGVGDMSVWGIKVDAPWSVRLLSSVVSETQTTLITTIKNVSHFRPKNKLRLPSFVLCLTSHF